MTRVIVLTGDPLGERMAGPGIRAAALAEQLTRAGHDVRLVTTAGGRLSAPYATRTVRPGDDAGMREQERWAEAIVLQGYGIGQFPDLGRTDRVLVADLYAPFHLELIEQARAGSDEPRATLELRVRIAERAILDQLGRADLILCANDRQRELYADSLRAIGREPHEELFRTVPFGLPAEPPQRAAGPVVRGVIPGIEPDAKLLVWGGGVYDWFDPLTLIRAVAQVAERDPRVRLFFMGTRNPRVGAPGMVGQAVSLAAELGVLGSAVIFNDDWVPYDERGAWLLEADAGVSTHRLHRETTYAFRTRILDYLWAGLPMVVTEGDGFADLVAAEQLGVVVPEGDVGALARAIATILDPAEAAAIRARIPAVAERYAWPRAVTPLTDFLTAPHHARDYVAGRRTMSRLERSLRTAGVGHDLRMALHHLRHSGPAGLIRRLRGRGSAA